VKRALLVLLVAGTAHADGESLIDTTTYKVKKGDSLGLIAAEFYGDRGKAIFIMVENRLKHSRALKAGERLRIPVVREITTAPGDTFESLAATLLGDALRGRFLAEANAMQPEDNLAAGTQLIVPFTVVHTAAAKERIRDVTAAYFGSERNAEEIRRFNNFESDTLEKGDSIIIPSFNVRIQASRVPGADADSKARRERKRETTERAAQTLPVARQAWRSGDYAMVKKVLADIDIAYLPANAAAEVGILLGCAHIAYEDTELAVASFKRVLDRKRTQKMRVFDHSPKIIALWKQAGGQVE
jgi:hypothetical protein